MGLFFSSQSARRIFDEGLYARFIIGRHNPVDGVVLSTNKTALLRGQIGPDG